ncbi:MAG: cytochrome c biogenesis protein ResB [Spirochaetia bacterium]|nr:cytochrome c biogenesis protein ResB [Spirochaetia bacterium]
MKAKEIIKKIFYALGSYQLALILIGFVLCLLFISIAIPQKGFFTLSEISLWEKENPGIGFIANLLDFYNIFQSYLFLSIVALLAVNILLCTIIKIIPLQNILKLKGSQRIRVYGFITVHISLLVLLTATFISSGYKMTGSLVLTENQSFIDEEKNYQYLAKGALRKKEHSGIMIRQKKIDSYYQEGKYHVRTDSYFEIIDKNNVATRAISKINDPYVFDDYAFTIIEVGYSPEIMIYDTVNQRQMANAFVALKTSNISNYRSYSDYLDLDFLKKRLNISVMPAHKEENGKIIKTGENIVNPIMFVEIEDNKGSRKKLGYIKLGEKIKIGSYDLYFMNLRRWNSFTIIDDPGYVLAAWALYIFVIGLMIRYFPDIKSWYKVENS